MQNTFLFQRSLGSNVAAISCTLGLAMASYLTWGAAVDREPISLGAGLKLAALALVVAWTHFLVWLFRKMSFRELSTGYCAMLFFGAWVVFFLIYSCLV